MLIQTNIFISHSELQNNSAFPYNASFGRLPEKESPPGPYQPSGALPPFADALMPNPETTKTLGNMNLGLNGNMQNVTEQIQVQMPHQVGEFFSIPYSNILCIVRFYNYCYHGNYLW